jgi:hypothetical protein
MKQVVFRYSIYATITIVILAAIHFYFINYPNVSWAVAEAAGWLSMVLAMIFIFFGIKHYRDHINGGSLSFGQGMKVGLLITLGPAVLFSLFDLLYVKVLNPNWSNDYFGYQVKEVTQSTPPDQLAEKLKELEEQKVFWEQPAMLFLLMFVTVFIIGIIITIISSLTLRRSGRPVTV